MLLSLPVCLDLSAWSWCTSFSPQRTVPASCNRRICDEKFTRTWLRFYGISNVSLCRWVEPKITFIFFRDLGEISPSPS